SMSAISSRPTLGIRLGTVCRFDHYGHYAGGRISVRPAFYVFGRLCRAWRGSSRHGKWFVLGLYNQAPHEHTRMDGDVGAGWYCPANDEWCDGWPLKALGLHSWRLPDY